MKELLERIINLYENSSKSDRDMEIFLENYSLIRERDRTKFNEKRKRIIDCFREKFLFENFIEAEKIYYRLKNFYYINESEILCALGDISDDIKYLCKEYMQEIEKEIEHCFCSQIKLAYTISSLHKMFNAFSELKAYKFSMEEFNTILCPIVKYFFANQANMLFNKYVELFCSGANTQVEHSSFKVENQVITYDDFFYFFCLISGILISKKAISKKSFKFKNMFIFLVEMMEQFNIPIGVIKC